MASMRAWVSEDRTGVDSLRLVERPIPAIRSGEVLVKMTAPCVAPVDGAFLANKNAAYTPQGGDLFQPGNRGVGLVEDPGQSEFRPGQRVMIAGPPYGRTREGCWAEYVAVEAIHLYPAPASVPDGAAAQAGVNYPTAYLALKAAGFGPGKTVLATGIGGTVGNAAYQLAKAFGSPNVLSTAGSTAKAEQAAAAGFDNVIDLSRESMTEGVHARTDGRGVDIVIDSIGGEVIAEAMKSVARHGVVVAIGFGAGTEAKIDLMAAVHARAHLQGFGVFTSPREDWQEAWRAFERLADAGAVKPLPARSFPFEQAPEALRYLQTARPFGSVALTL